METMWKTMAMMLVAAGMTIGATNEPASAQSKYCVAALGCVPSQSRALCTRASNSPCNAASTCREDGYGPDAIHVRLSRWPHSLHGHRR